MTDMATAAFRDWVAKGRPWFNAIPVAAYRTALHAAGWPYIELGTIGDEAHLQAEHPQDHCPFSFTGWPGPHPYPNVLALDVTHSPQYGRDVAPLAAYWIAEAMAGRTPWVKYITWRQQRWDVRNDWRPVSATGHNDHAHISFRTDHVHTSIGLWPVVGKGQPVTTSETGRQVWAETISSPSIGKTMSAADWVKYAWTADYQAGHARTAAEAAQKGVQALLDRPPVAVDPVALAEALAASETFVDALADALATRLGQPVTAVELRETFESARITIVER